MNEPLMSFNDVGIDIDLLQMHPGEDIDIDRLISTVPPFDEYQVNEHFQPTSSKPLIQQSTFPAGVDTTSTPSECSDESEPEDLSHIALAEDLKRLNTRATANRYFGQARHVISIFLTWGLLTIVNSAFMFLKHVATIRSQITGETFTGPDPRKYRRHIYWDVRPVCSLDVVFHDIRNEKPAVGNGLRNVVRNMLCFS